MKLTKAQERAKAKLTHEWQSMNDVKERLSTLEGLVARGVAEREFHATGLPQGAPQAAIHYRLAH